MFHNQSRTHSTPSRGTIPQGIGREGKRKGSGTERFRNVSCGFSGSSQFQVTVTYGRRLGFGAIE